MSDMSKIKPTKETIDKGTNFLRILESDMKYKSNYSGTMISFDWIDEIEEACPYIDTIIRIPKSTLIREEIITSTEKSKKADVASIKDLSKHTEYINKFDKKTDSVEPSKILDIRSEETYNIYENRFLYTLVHDLGRFVASKEKMLNNFEISDSKLLEYKSSTNTKYEMVDIEVKLVSKTIPSKDLDDSLRNEIENVKQRLKRIKEYISSWERSAMIKALSKAHIHYIDPPIKKTNITLKNPNFKIAVKLWEYILKYDYENNGNEKDKFAKEDDDILMTYLNQAFLINYFVSDSAVPFKREQKMRMAKASIFILKEQIEIIMKLLSSMGYKITKEQLLKIAFEEPKSEKETRLVGAEDVKKKFKNAMEEYLERTQDYL